MKKAFFVIGMFFTVIFLARIAVIRADETPVKLVPVLKINKEYDKRTTIKPSTVPNGGNGLFAAAPIKKGEVIGELGGRLVTAEDPPAISLISRRYLSAHGKKLNRTDTSIARIS